MRRLAHEVLPPLAGIAGLIVVWGVIAASTSSPSIPSPLAVWDALVDGLRAGTIQEAALKTLIRLAFSFVVAVVLGTGLGVLLALNEFARRAIRPLIVALQITPFVAWVPLAVVWFGVSERAVVFVAIVGSFPAMALATLQAIRQVPPLYERAGRTLGARDTLPRSGHLRRDLQQTVRHWCADRIWYSAVGSFYGRGTHQGQSRFRHFKSVAAIDAASTPVRGISGASGRFAEALFSQSGSHAEVVGRSISGPSGMDRS